LDGILKEMAAVIKENIQGIIEVQTPRLLRNFDRTALEYLRENSPCC
jgi:hypothetical protein